MKVWLGEVNDFLMGE